MINRKMAVLFLLMLSVFLLVTGCKKDGDTIIVLGDTDQPPGTGEWTLVSPTGKGGVDFPTARSGHAMAYDSTSGVSILFGGKNANGYCCDTWEYDGSTWTNVSPAGTPGIDYPAPRFRHTMTYDPINNVVVLFGGSRGQTYLDDTWQWNGSAWSNVSPSGSPGVDFPGPRDEHAMAYDPVNSTVMLFGGYVPSTGQLGDVWTWNASAWTQVPLTGNPDVDYPAQRKGHAMATDSINNLVLLYGGHNETTGVYSDIWEWNGSAWTDASPGGIEGSDYPYARQNLAAAYNPASQLLTICFGQGDSGSHFYNLWEWNGSAWNVVSIPGGLPYTDYPAGPIFTAMTYDTANSRMILFGGGFKDGSHEYLEDATWEWDGIAWKNVTFNSAPGTDMPWRRSAHAMAYDPVRNVSVLFGGYGNWMNYKSDTWTWNGSVWSMVSPASGQMEGIDYPDSRTGHAMAFNSTGGTVVLFGGEHPFKDIPADTWLWDGTLWSKVTYATSDIEGLDYPTARTGHAMVHDSSRGVAVLFGGSDWHNCSDTWEWNGSAWSKVSPASGQVEGIDYPEARKGHSMAFDTKRGVVVLFGGSGLNGSRSDTWEWNGASWVKASCNGIPGIDYPEARYFHSMAYHADIGAVVLYGGMNHVTSPSTVITHYYDTWLWDGTSWFNVTPAGVRGTDFPDVNVYHAMTSDSARGKVVLFGGIGPGLPSSDTWEY